MSLRDEGSVGDWPQNGLEWLNDCPVCHQSERQLLYSGLQDQIFFCAPGKWSLYRCAMCSSAYIDPRPTRDTIGLAYRRYYTHGSTAPNSGGCRRFDGILRRMANGYRNARYGTRDFPALRLGTLLLAIASSQRARVDAGMRHLPRACGDARLLDVGCGDGNFLRRAKSAGWSTIGVDPDPNAVAAARAHGLDVREGGIEVFGDAKGLFDGITLSHVIEHVHDPLALLSACERLLKPGGWVWVDTPNLCSLGHRRFGRHWRDLDPPRHLVLFTPDSLTGLLERAGFSSVATEPWTPLCLDIFSASEAIRLGMDPIVNPIKTINTRVIAARSDLVAKSHPELREFITLRAFKGPGNA